MGRIRIDCGPEDSNVTHLNGVLIDVDQEHSVTGWPKQIARMKRLELMVLSGAQPNGNWSLLLLSIWLRKKSVAKILGVRVDDRHPMHWSRAGEVLWPLLRLFERSQISVHFFDSQRKIYRNEPSPCTRGESSFCSEHDAAIES